MTKLERIVKCLQNQSRCRLHFPTQQLIRPCDPYDGGGVEQQNASSNFLFRTARAAYSDSTNPCRAFCNNVAWAACCKASLKPSCLGGKTLMSETQLTGHVRSKFTIMQSPLWDMMPFWYVQQPCCGLARSLLLQHRLLPSNMRHNRSHASCLLQACACVVWGFPYVAEHVA